MKKLIINPVGGLANRMRAVASGVSLSRRLGMGVPAVAWPMNDDLFCGFDSLFDSPVLGGHVNDIGALKDIMLYDIPRKKNLYLADAIQAGRYGLKLTDWDRLPSFADAPGLLEDEVVKVSGSVLIRSGVVFYPFSKELYRSLFVPKREFADEASARIEASGGNVVGLHVRRSDNAISIKHSPLGLFIDAVEREMADNPGVMFYLASDDAAVKAGLKARYGGRIIISEKPAVRNTPEGIKEALTEIITLSLCREVYGSYWSSFSEAAALLGNTTLIQLKK